MLFKPNLYRVVLTSLREVTVKAHSYKVEEEFFTFFHHTRGKVYSVRRQNVLYIKGYYDE